MSGLFGSSANSTANNAAGDIKNDVALVSPPEDGVSEISFSPAAEYLAVSSWDKKVRIYEINPTNFQSEGRAVIEHEGPVLGCCWSKVSPSG
jgi:mRNA export factor